MPFKFFWNVPALEWAMQQCIPLVQTEIISLNDLILTVSNATGFTTSLNYR